MMKFDKKKFETNNNNSDKTLKEINNFKKKPLNDKNNNNTYNKKMDSLDVLVQKPEKLEILCSNKNITFNKKIYKQTIDDFENLVSKFLFTEIPDEPYNKKMIFCTSEIIDVLLLKAMINFYFYEYVVSFVENKSLKSKKLEDVYLNYLGLVKYLEISGSSCEITNICNQFHFVAKREFYYPNNQSFNRIYCKSFCYSSMSKFLRGSLIKDIYIDVDLENAGPSILYDIALKHNIFAPYLKQLVFNRENFYKKVDSASRENAKTLVIHTINRIVPPNNFLCEKLLEEIHVIREKIWECRKDWGYEENALLKSDPTKTKTHLNNLRFVQTKYCNYKESQSLLLLKSIVEMFLTHNFEKQKIFGKYELPYSFIPAFDGALIRMYSLNLEENRQVLKALVDIVNVELGGIIKFKIKPVVLETDFDLDLFNRYKNIEVFLQSVSLNDLKKFCVINNVELFKFSDDDLRIIRENFFDSENQLLNFKFVDKYRLRFMLKNREFYQLLKEYANDSQTLQNYFEKCLGNDENN